MRGRLVAAVLGAAFLAGCGGTTVSVSSSDPPAPGTAGHHLALAAFKSGASLTASVQVPAQPTGPAGSWHVVFADAFGVPLSQDSIWELKTNVHGCCNNTSPNETSSEAPSAVHWSEGNGLELRCEGLVCSGISEKAFTYELGRGATFAFQIVARLPYDGSHNGEDPGAWGISTTRWPPEFDWFEWWGWKCTPPSCVGGFPVYHGTAGQKESYITPGETYWTQTHTYTTVVEGSTFTEYIDGAKKGTANPFTETVNTDQMDIILTHALRETTAGRNSSFNVRSVAIYEDSAHAGQAVHGERIAPGTVVAGSEPPPPPPPVEEDPAKDEAAIAAAKKALTAAEAAVGAAKEALVAAQAD